MITGVAWLLRDFDGKKSGFCIENRIALTKAEQEEIGILSLSAAKYPFPRFTIGEILNKYIEKMNAKVKKFYLIIRYRFIENDVERIADAKKDKCDLKATFSNGCVERSCQKR